MFSEEEKRGFLDEAASSERRADFARMRANALSARLTPEEHIAFLNAASLSFNRAFPHPAVADKGKFLI